MQKTNLNTRKIVSKKILFICALHGDEGFGVNIMKKIEKELSPQKYGYDWIIGNPEAYKKNVRFLEADLNRVAPGNSNSKIYEEKRAAELVKLSSQYKFIIDLHGSVSDCDNVSIIPYPTMQNLILASMLGIKRNVIWYSKASLKKGPVTQFTQCPAIEIENGPQNSLVVQDRLEKIIKRFVKRLNSLSNTEVFSNISDIKFYAVYDKRFGEHDKNFKDFKLYRDGKESYYPFLANQYKGVTCYKMKEVDVSKYLLYD